jgi:hypothetical protein
MPYTLGTPTAVRQNTPATNAGDPDMMTWPSSPPYIVDKYGKLFGMVRWVRNADNTQYHRPVVSNDGGATWSEPTMSGFYNNTNGDIALVHGASAYDPTNDIWHTLWTLAQGDGAVIYRRLVFVRDAVTHDITGITRTRSIQLEVGVDNALTTHHPMTFESPLCAWIPEGGAYGTVLCGWSAVNDNASASKAELRLTMLRVNNADASDAVLGNWLAPLNEASGAGASDTLASVGLPKYSCLAKSAANVQPFASLTRKQSGAGGVINALDLIWSVSLNGAFYANWAAWSAANNDWRGGLGAAVANDAGALTLSAIQRAPTDAGYTLKYQLISKHSEDVATGNVYVAFPTWKDNANGDTWTYCYISNGGTRSALVDAYSAGGAHSYAPTGDLMWDATAGVLVVTYEKTTTQYAYLKTYQGTTLVQDETAVFTTAPVDIPYVLPVRVNDLAMVVVRDTTTRTGTDRYYGYAVTMVWTGGAAPPADGAAASSGGLVVVVAPHKKRGRVRAWMTDREKAVVRARNAVLGR